jgi:hypothetical protein
MIDNFYENLKGFSQFSQLTDESYYVPAPDDWYVVITDVKGSTQAIADGRYKEVNLVGAAAIIAVLNTTGRIPIPYAFGGDGATMLIPAHMIDSVKETLSAVQAKVKAIFDMELRAGCVKISDLYAKKAWLKVAKFHLSPAISQAAFQGTALALAETWLKKGGGPVINCTATNADDANLEGLECRWQPIQNRHGTMVSLLVRVTPEHEANAWNLYGDIMKQIADIYPEAPDAFPVQANRMQMTFDYSKLSKEAKIRAGQNPVSYAIYLLLMYIQNMLGSYSFRTGKKVGTFDGQKYLAEMAANSDAKKFDEMLRMVLDSTIEQKASLESMLKVRQKKGEIVYGIHESSQALMTCLVFSLAGNHVHFVDGADGGYALAAKQMKQQIAKTAEVA